MRSRGKRYRDYVYMMVSNDIYELPLAVAGSASELASMVGVRPETILACIRKHNNSKYQRIYVGEADND